MLRWKNILFNITIAINTLLVFLLIVESRIGLPAWVQVLGRMHPLFMHFPIVLLVLFSSVSVLLYNKIDSDEEYQHAAGLFLIVTAFTAAITALMGLFLSREPGYDADALQWHKWTGVIISVSCLCWYALYKNILSNKIISTIVAAVAFVLVIFTGHEGAEITHGKNYLLSPVMPDKKQVMVSAEDAIVYTDMVAPILKAKCASCHNSKKAKGELIMETEELLLKGGKNGKLWDTAAADLGLMLHRVHLPLDQKKHMPPQGKPQLTEDEIAILTAWVRKGADFKMKLASLPALDELQQLGNKIFMQAEMATYDFDAADAAVVEKLNTVNRVVKNEATGSPALNVSFFNSSIFNGAQLNELDKVKKQIVTLNLNKMPLTDADIKTISGFDNLRRLNLSFTGINGTTLSELTKLKHLTTLSLSGTNVTAAQLSALQKLNGLKTVYVWHTKAAGNELEQLQSVIKNIRFITGYNGDTTIIKLTPPVVLNEEGFISTPIPLRLKHYIQGAAIRYTTDGSMPDSILSPLYTGKEIISSNVLVRAKAYKFGWISSDLVEVNFYKTTYTPDSAIYLLPADSSYADERYKKLFDHEKGETNFRSGKWVGFRKNNMSCILHFASPVPVQSVTLSCLLDYGSYIMPPQKIEIWGGDDPKQLKLLGQQVPEQPTMLQPAYLRGFECKFAPVTVKYIKVVGITVGKLPAWHPGKGDKAWIFTDEVLIN
jgi:uncharacterized membrane protein